MSDKFNFLKQLFNDLTDAEQNAFLAEIKTEKILILKPTKTKVKHPQTNGIYEPFHKTILQEF